MSNPCPPGKVYNTKTSRCVSREGKIGKKILKDLGECPEGKVFNTVSKRCVSREGKLGKQILKDKKASPKRKSPKKASPKKSSPKRKSSPKKSSPKRASPKKSSPKKSSPKKSSPKKSSPKKSSPKKSSPKKASPKKASAKRKSPKILKKYYPIEESPIDIDRSIFKKYPLNVYTDSTTGDKWWGIVYKKKFIFHREDGPAFEGLKGKKMWMRYGVLHRVGGPALIVPSFNPLLSGIEEWRVNGILHREDGPAILRYGDKKWYLNGTQYTEQEFNKIRYLIALKKIDPLGKKGKYDYKDLYNIIADYANGEEEY